MKIKDILMKNGFSISFEVFPPKTEYAFESVKNAVHDISKLKPAFISVTYGAGGGTSRYTLDIARKIMKEYDVPSLAHLTCVSSSRESVREKIREFKESGIENIMALRGDLTPELEKGDRSKWDYRHATDLIADIRDICSDMCIGGACYPEVHPESLNQEEDIAFLKAKVDAGCDFLTTQMFFDNNLFFNFMYKIREAGINVPIMPGIMPITSAKQVERAIKLSGSFMPQRFKTLVDKFGYSDETMMQAGIIYATDQIIDLYANGIKNVHVYSMNKPEVAEKIMSNISTIIK